MGKQRPHLGRQKQNFVCTKTQGEGAVTPQKTEPDFLLMLEGLLWRCWPAMACHGDMGTRGSTPGRCPWARPSWKVAINTTTQPRGPRAGLPQAKQITGREHSPTHQQITGLKFYWARPCPEQDPVYPIRKLTQVS